MQENGEKIDIFSLENGASAYSLEFRGEGNSNDIRGNKQTKNEESVHTDVWMCESVNGAHAVRR